MATSLGRYFHELLKNCPIFLGNVEPELSRPPKGAQKRRRQLFRWCLGDLLTRTKASSPAVPMAFHELQNSYATVLRSTGGNPLARVGVIPHRLYHTPRHQGTPHGAGLTPGRAARARSTPPPSTGQHALHAAHGARRAQHAAGRPRAQQAHTLSTRARLEVARARSPPSYRERVRALQHCV